MPVKKLDEVPRITAQPRPVSEELVSAPIAERGLSIAPEDMGRQFLSEALEQRNFESSSGGDANEVDITEAALTDDALTGAAWEAGDVWESTVNLSLQSGGLEEGRAVDKVAGEIEEEDEKQEEAVRALSGDSHDVDMTKPSIHQASLLDYETDELGGVASPDVDTDELSDLERRREAAKQEVDRSTPDLPKPRRTRRARGAL